MGGNGSAEFGSSIVSLESRVRMLGTPGLSAHAPRKPNVAYATKR
jgi:hypothetical protein